MKIQQICRILILSICTSLTMVISVSGAQDSVADIEKISFTHYSTNEGLSHSTVLSCCQDSLGHLWFGTFDGLNRFDGNRFTSYKHNPSDSTSIDSDLIRKVYVDKSGTVWIGTEKGLSRYDHNKDAFQNFDTGGKIVTGIAETGTGNHIMLAAGGNIHFFNTDSKTWDDFALPIQRIGLEATILYRHENRIWIGTQSGGLFCYNIKESDLTKISSVTTNKSIQCIITDGNYLWIATEGDGLFKLDTKTGQCINYKHSPPHSNSLSSNYIRTLARDCYGRLWIGTFNGLSILGEVGFTNISSSPFEQGSLSQSSVRCITTDNQGGMWLGTWLGGINYWHPLKNRFTSIRREAKGNSLNDNITSCITEEKDGSLWIGTKSEGVNHFNAKTRQFSYYKLPSMTSDGPLESNDIKAIYIDEETSDIYVGAHAGGLNIIDRKTSRITHCTYNDKTKEQLDVYAIIPDEGRSLWIGTLNGLKRFNMQTGKFVSITTDLYGNPLPYIRIKTLMKDSNKRLWIGGENELRCYKISENGELDPVQTKIFENTFNKSYIQCIFESSTKLIWISTRKGLFCYDDKNGEITHYTVADGLPHNAIQGMEEDSYGRLWISTENGLTCFNPFSGTFRNFSIADGLTSNQFNTYSHCRKRNGQMLFGGMDGISVFSPENMKDNPYTPEPQITGLMIYNKKLKPGDETGILGKNILLTDKLTLKHNQNSLTFEYTVPNYLSGQHNTFSYKLEGFDKEWYETDKLSVSYSHLRHGRYRFLLKAANNDGKWNPEPTILNIRILPIWYNTIAARIILLILFMGLICFSYKVIMERKERENKEEIDRMEKAHQEDIHQMKMRFFINISHEMRTPLTLIINPLQELITKSNDTWIRKQLKYVERNAKRLMHLVNQLMDYRRAELGVFKLKIRPEDVHGLIKENWTFYEKLAQSKKIQYSLISELEGKTLYIDGQYLELILNNILSNAFKYTESGHIIVKASEKDGFMLLEVSDTGEGIPYAEQGRIFERFYQVSNEHIGSGIGLSLVHRLVELHHGRISLKSDPGVGTTFTVSLPLSLSAYTSEELVDSNPEAHSSNTREYYLLDTEIEEDSITDSSDTKHGKLLIAEDNEEIRTYLSNELSSLFDIVLAKNGEEALQLLKVQKPDIIITDRMMPIIDGLKLCSSIKQNISTSHIPIIMLSAKTESKDQLEALKAGADDYMTKPFSMAVLIAKIQNMLRTHLRVHDKAVKSMDISPEKLSFNALDEQILKNAIEIVEKNIDNTDFSTEEFAQAMNMSRSNLHIKLKALTGESALDFIRKIRFKEACRLLKEGRHSISEISDMVGFNTPSYFATCFKKYMGCLPTEYVKNLK